MNVLITGGGSGLGKIISESLLSKNYKVIVIDKLSPHAIEKDYISKIIYYQFDLSNINDLNFIIEDIYKNFNSIDVLINNAALRNFNTFEDFTLEEIFKLINVNYTTALILSRLVLKRMIQKNFGRIINISSVSSLYGYYSGTLYCSTKAALNIFTEALAKELTKNNKNITINTILPDSFITREGVKLKHYNYIVNNIINKINFFIQSRLNGKLTIVSPLGKKIFIFLHLLRYRIFRLLI
ncbi:MAG: SDR family oxidoreductase [bacterium]|nr:SDR family oxidoreductase [bacterium]